MKTPEAIKKGLECCMKASEEACDLCPYSKGCERFEAGNLYRDALAYIDQIEQRLASVGEMSPEWVSVKDRLPEYYTDVLVFVKENGASWILIAYMTTNGMWGRNGGGRIGGIVTRWMPLPEPPKEE